MASPCLRATRRAFTMFTIYTAWLHHVHELHGMAPPCSRATRHGVTMFTSYTSWLHRVHELHLMTSPCSRIARRVEDKAANRIRTKHAAQVLRVCAAFIFVNFHPFSISFFFRLLISVTHLTKIHVLKSEWTHFKASAAILHTATHSWSS